MTHASWYFDFVSPFAYLQSRMLGRFGGKAELALKPVLLAPVARRLRRTLIRCGP